MNSVISKKYVIALMFLFLGAGLAAFFYSRNSNSTAQPSVKNSADSKPTLPVDVKATHAAADTKPGTTAEASTSKTASADKQENNTKDAAANDPFNYGKTPRLPANINESTAAAAEAAKTQKHPERLSVMISPAPFDPEAYRQNPKAYLSVVEPGRVNQPKQPAGDVPRIQTVGSTFLRMTQGQSVELQVRSVPKFPVTWTSYDLGRFSNELTSITVEADENGMASTKFFAPPGTIADVHILCASPMASGQVRFKVNVAKSN